MIDGLVNYFPDVDWKIGTPEQEVTDTFGKGVMLIGCKYGFCRDFFVPFNADIYYWAGVIKTELETLKDELANLE